MKDLVLMTATERALHAKERYEDAQAKLDQLSDNGVKIPYTTGDAILRHRFFGEPGGGFIEALLSNDLRSCIGRGDLTNIAALSDTVRYLISNVPAGAWGSHEKVVAWREKVKEDLQGPTHEEVVEALAEYYRSLPSEGLRELMEDQAKYQLQGKSLDEALAEYKRVTGATDE